MTRKDFIALAAALKRTMPAYTSDKGHADYGIHGFVYDQWRDDVMAVIDVLTQANPRFHRGRFLAACGIPNIEHADKLKQEIINYHTRAASPENDEGE